MGIALNLILFAAKLIAALTTGSIAVIADAFNNLGDAGSSVVAMVGFKLSNKKPDLQHPFGHGRIEYITGFVVSVVIIVMGFELGLSSVKSIGTTAVSQPDTATVVILCTSVLIKLYMALYNYKLSRFFSSATMKAICTDSLADAVSTTGVLVALLVSKRTGLHLDSYMGILVSLFVLYSGMVSARDTIAPLLGLPPEKEFVENIKRIVLSSPSIVGMHDLVVHDYGPGRRMISLHAEMPSSIDVFKAHCIIDDLESELSEKLGCEATIHFDPIDEDDRRLTELKDIVYEIIREINPAITMHDFRYVPGETHTNLLFDIVIPFGIKCSDTELTGRIREKVAEKLPNHNCIIKCDSSRIL